MAMDKSLRPFFLRPFLPLSLYSSLSEEGLRERPLSSSPRDLNTGCTAGAGVANDLFRFILAAFTLSTTLTRSLRCSIILCMV